MARGRHPERRNLEAECINAVIQTLEFDAADGGFCVIHDPFVFDIEE